MFFSVYIFKVGRKAGLFLTHTFKVHGSRILNAYFLGVGDRGEGDWQNWLMETKTWGRHLKQAVSLYLARMWSGWAQMVEQRGTQPSETCCLRFRWAGSPIHLGGYWQSWIKCHCHHSIQSSASGFFNTEVSNGELFSTISSSVPFL